MPHGALGIHVDDGIGGGDPVFQKAIQELERQFPFGSKLYKDFKFTGLRIRQKARLQHSRGSNRVCARH